MKPRRASFRVDVDLDPIPGFGHDTGSWRLVLERLLAGAASHYHPVVTDLEQPGLAELQARYLEVRQHTLSTDGLTGWELWRAEAEYVTGEARELEAAVYELCPADWVPGVDEDELMRHVRHEIADVAIAAATLAGMLPGHVTVEACIAEKTEHDRGRG